MIRTVLHCSLLRNLMELSSQLCNLRSYPSSSPILARRRQNHVDFVSSNGQMITSWHGNASGFFPVKQTVLRFPKTHSLPPIVCGTKRHQPQTLSSFYNEPEPNGLSTSYDCHGQHKSSRSVVVRSELASTGPADASNSLSDIWLNSKVRGVCFYVVTSVAAIVLIIPMFLEHPLVLMFDRYCRKATYVIAKLWASLSVAPFVKIEYEGIENLPSADTPAVYVSNHQSFFDIYTLLILGRSFKFISKTSIFLYPIIGWAMFLLGVIPLKRLDSRSQLECFKRCMALINKGASVFFFPEGTRSKDGKLGSFKKGAFSVAAKTGVPVVPISLVGTGSIMPPGQENILNPGTVKVIVHRPIVGNKADELCSEARNVIADELMRYA